MASDAIPSGEWGESGANSLPPDEPPTGPPPPEAEPPLPPPPPTQVVDYSQSPGGGPPDGPLPPEDRGQPSAPQPWHERFAPRPAFIGLGLASLLLLALAGLGAWYVLGLRSAAQTYNPQITPPASLGDLATQYPQMASVLTDPNLASAYKDFLLAYEQGGLDAAYDLAQKRALLNANGDLRLTLELDTTQYADLRAQLESFGVVVSAAHGNEMDIVVPRPLLEQLVLTDDPASLFENISGLEHIVRIRLPIPSQQDDQGIQTESIPIIGADVWHNAGITGKGVKVGVLDRGFDAYRALLGTDLPAQVTARSFIAGQEIDHTGSVHGSAVAEIIYDIAPDAELYLAAYDTDVEKRQAIDWLVSQGVRIISHSAGSVYGPMDGSGPDARMVDQLVNDGILWVNSAGNCGYTHYRGTFTDKDGDGYHEFAPGDEMMEIIPDGRTIFVLNWDEWGDTKSDFDLYLMDSKGNVVASSTDVQGSPRDDPAEGFVYTFSDSNVYYVAFKANRASRPAVFDFFMRDGQIEYYTPDHSVTTPGDARRSLTVGATGWSNDSLEDYSSRGPTNDGRMKPDLVGPSGVSSAAYGSTWDGTSASTPHVAGAAALVLQVFPAMSPDQVAQYLKDRAVDLGPGGPDDDYGFGRLALGEPPSLDQPPAQPTPIPTPAATLPTPTAAAQAAATPSATPERVILATPLPSASDSGSAATLIVALLACVAAPGLLGLGGIGLFAAVWYLRRSPPQPTPRLAPRRPEAGYASYPPIQRPPAARPAPPAPASPPSPANEASEACPRCGAPHRSGARFCSTCGLALDAGMPPPEEQAFCTKCGQRLRASSKFCPYCGHPR